MGLRLLPAAALALWLGSAADRPPLQDAAEWPEPTDRTPLRVNPPTFRWPAGEARGPLRELVQEWARRRVLAATRLDPRPMKKTGLKKSKRRLEEDKLKHVPLAA